MYVPVFVFEKKHTAVNSNQVRFGLTVVAINMSKETTVEGQAMQTMEGKPVQVESTDMGVVDGKLVARGLGRGLQEDSEPLVTKNEKPKVVASVHTVEGSTTTTTTTTTTEAPTNAECDCLPNGQGQFVTIPAATVASACDQTSMVIVEVGTYTLDATAKLCNATELGFDAWVTISGGIRIA